jgi:ferredoxin
MTEKRRWKAYLAIFAAMAFVSAVVTPVAIMTFDNFACRTQPQSPDDFLAYCHSLRYGDYEHGALYYGLEPKARESIRAAQVLFLGSSRLQAGFAANATREYFRARGIRYFVMGFGYGDVSAFEQPVIERSGASPKVIVINADPFFVEPNILSKPAKEAIEGGLGYLWRLTLKMAFQRVHRIICRAVPLCPESEPSIFRSATDGQWNWIGPQTEEREVPIDQIKERLPQFEIERAKTIGEMFLNWIGLDRRCVVFTGIPSNVNSTEVAEVLATALRTRFLAPKIDGLATVDGGHLNSRSAELWSAAFLEALTPIVNECLGQLLGSRREAAPTKAAHGARI